MGAGKVTMTPGYVRGGGQLISPSLVLLTARRLMRAKELVSD